MGEGNEGPTAQPSDQPTKAKGDKPAGADSLKGWNDRAVERTTGSGDRRKLSPEEAAERKSRAKPKHGMAFDYDKGTLPKGEFDRWYKGLSPEQKALLKKPGTTIEVWGHASRPGSDAYNQRLSKQRADSVKQELQKRLGIPESAILADGFGESAAVDNVPPGADPRKFENKDDRNDRVADIVIVPKESASRNAPATGDDASRAGKRVGEGAKIDKPKPKYTPEDGMRDLPGFVKDYKKVIKEAVKRTFEAIHELHQANKQASYECGVRYGVLIVKLDAISSAKNPHIETGKPYTADELRKKVDGSSLKQSFHREMTGNLVMNKDGYNDAKRGMKIVADEVNKLLAGAKTPEARKKALNDFSKGLMDQLAKNRQARKR